MVNMANFDYHNENPFDLKENDCTIRAITFVTGLNYYTVKHKMELVAELLECTATCPCCYFHLVDYVFKFPRVNCKGMTVGEFAKRHPRGIYLIRMDSHISSIMDGRIKDTFDCSDYIATDCWFCGE